MSFRLGPYFIIYFYPLALTSFGEWSASLFKFPQRIAPHNTTLYTHASAGALASRAGSYTDNSCLPDRKSRFVRGFKEGHVRSALLPALSIAAALGRARPGHPSIHNLTLHCNGMLSSQKSKSMLY